MVVCGDYWSNLLFDAAALLLMESKKIVMNKIIKITSLALLIIALQIGTYSPVTAQCPMCRMSATNNLKDGGTAGKGLNSGILYMLATPYLIVGVIGYVWWRNRRKEEEIIMEENGEMRG